MTSELNVSRDNLFQLPVFAYQYGKYNILLINNIL